jgi:hypothetical protein
MWGALSGESTGLLFTIAAGYGRRSVPFVAFYDSQGYGGSIR